jgi:hypothetical protein
MWGLSRNPLMGDEMFDMPNREDVMQELAYKLCERRIWFEENDWQLWELWGMLDDLDSGSS